MAAILGEPVGKTVGYRVRFDSKSPPRRASRWSPRYPHATPADRPGWRIAVVFGGFTNVADADLSRAHGRRSRRPSPRTSTHRHVRHAGTGGPRGGVQRSARRKRRRWPLLVSEGRSFPWRRRASARPGETSATSRPRRWRPCDAHSAKTPDRGRGRASFLPGAGEINRWSRRCAATRRRFRFRRLSREDRRRARPAPPGTRRVVNTPIAEKLVDHPACAWWWTGPSPRGVRPSERDDATGRRFSCGRARINVEDERLAPGACYRMWSEATHAALGSDDPPEIKSRISRLLDLGRGARIRASPGWTRPRGTMDAARDLLHRLGAIERDAKGRVAVTPAGRRMANLPLHPRMARMVLWDASRGPESEVVSGGGGVGGRGRAPRTRLPADIRCRLGAMWDANGKGARLVASAPTSSPPAPAADARRGRPAGAHRHRR